MFFNTIPVIKFGFQYVLLALLAFGEATWVTENQVQLFYSFWEYFLLRLAGLITTNQSSISSFWEEFPLLKAQLLLVSRVLAIYFSAQSPLLESVSSNSSFEGVSSFGGMTFARKTCPNNFIFSNAISDVRRFVFGYKKNPTL